MVCGDEGYYYRRHFYDHHHFHLRRQQLQQQLHVNDRITLIRLYIILSVTNGMTKEMCHAWIEYAANQMLSRAMCNDDA